MKLCLTGDVMIGRMVNRKLNKHLPEYLWGNVLPLMLDCDLRLINLESTLTRSDDKVKKAFNFRSDPSHVDCLKKAQIDVVTLANNHVLDYGSEGFVETLETLDAAEIQRVGAGMSLADARKPVILERDGVKIGILGCTDNEPDWAATEGFLGTHYVRVSDVEKIGNDIEALRPQVDVLVLTMHWGPNMRQTPRPNYIHFAKAMIEWGVDIFHGHSSHVFQGVQDYKGKLIIFDAGDFVDDYAVDPYLHNDRAFLFVVDVDKDGPKRLHMYPTVIDDCQVNLAQGEHFAAAVNTMIRLSSDLGSSLERQDYGLSLALS